MHYAVTECQSMEDLDSRIEAAGEKLICIYFTAPWCAPCKLTSKCIEEIATEEKDVLFLKVNVAELEDATDKYEIAVMPTFCFIKNKEKLECVAGSKLDTLKEALGRLKVTTVATEAKK